MSKPVIAMVGLGYVGLSTAVAFASRGMHVTGYDVDESKVAQINSGEPTFYEPKVRTLLRTSLKRGFVARNTLGPADVYFVTVGTPSLPNGSIDLTFVKDASREIGRVLKNMAGYQLLVIRSTVLPGTTLGVVRPAVESESGRRVGDELGLAMNPEFLREGSAVQDTLEPDRLVIGEADTKSGDSLLKLYKKFYEAGMPRVLRTNPVNAELIKYANNSFLATKVSYINMIANLCEKLPGADVEVVTKGLGMDNRIGPAFLKAGAGWGGSCWPKDLRALKASFSESGVEAPIIDATLEVNEYQPRRLVQTAKALLGGLEGRRIAVLGLAFKPDTDDIREAVSLTVIRTLLAESAVVRVYDPAAIDNAKKVLHEEVTYASSSIEAIKGTDCCIIVTEWNEFRKLKPGDFRSNMNSPIVIDGRRIYNPEKLTSLRYTAVGLGVTSDYNAKGWPASS